MMQRVTTRVSCFEDLRASGKMQCYRCAENLYRPHQSKFKQTTYPASNKNRPSVGLIAITSAQFSAIYG